MTSNKQLHIPNFFLHLRFFLTRGIRSLKLTSHLPDYHTHTLWTGMCAFLDKFVPKIKTVELKREEAIFKAVWICVSSFFGEERKDKTNNNSLVASGWGEMVVYEYERISRATLFHPKWIWMKGNYYKRASCRPNRHKWLAKQVPACFAGRLHKRWELASHLTDSCPGESKHRWEISGALSPWFVGNLS